MKYKNTLFSLFLFICVLFAISGISAGDVDDSVMTAQDGNIVYMSQNDDLSDQLTTEIDTDEHLADNENEEIIGEVDDGTFTALKNKIINAASGSTITLENDYKYDDACDPRYGITICNKELTINGNGHKIDGLSKSRIFSISGSDRDYLFKVTLNNIVFCNGYSDEDGGAIIAKESTLSSYPLIIRNCQFIGNKAENGGAISISQGRYLDMSGCVFKSNSASNYGGAISTSFEPGNFNDCSFIKNSAGYGGAIYFGITYDGCQNDVKNCVFTSNSATKTGGAIYGYDDKSTKVIKCTFSNNKASKGRDVSGVSTSKCVFNYLKLTLKSVKVKKSAKKLVLTATLKKGNTPINSKKVIFKFNGKTYKAKTNKKGVAKVTIKKKILKKLKVGKKVKYQAKYGKLIIKKTVKVKK